MPSDERATKIAGRCETHPGAPAVAACDGCGRALCIVCAVPVRGRVLGHECLPADAKSPNGDEPLRPPRPGASRIVLGSGFGVALLATALRWTRFGEAARPFGAWAWDPRWSMLAAAAALAGSAIWVVGRRRGGRTWSVLLAGLGAAVAVGSLLSILNPPPFTKAAVWPWVSLAGGILASGAAALEAASVRRP